MKHILFLLIVGGLLVIAYVAVPLLVQEAPQLGEAQTSALVESYIREHISELSPEKEVLGGKFYITEITLTEKTGTVSYEDGHIALVADFTYVIQNRAVVITSFVVRSDR